MNILLWLRKHFDALDKKWIFRSDAKITSFSMFALLQQLVTNHSNSYAKAIVKTLSPDNIMTPSAFSSKQRRRFDPAMIREVYMDLYRETFDNKPSVECASNAQMQFIAVDGSTLLIKRPSTGVRVYDRIASGGYYSHLYVSVAYDMTNRVALDCEFFDRCHERLLLQRHVNRLTPSQSQCWVMDRGYYSWGQLCFMDAHETHFVFRMPKHICTVKHFLTGSSNDCLVSMTDTSSYSKKGNQKKTITVRLVKWTQGTSVFVLCTNLFNKEKYPISRLREIYKKRWEVESYYKTLKRTMDLEHCHTSDFLLIQQEVWTAMLTSLVARVMERQNEVPNKTTRTNHASSISWVAELVSQMNKRQRKRKHKRIYQRERFKTMSRISQWSVHKQSRFFPRIVKHPVSCFGRNAKTENDIKKFYNLGGLSDESWK